MKNRKQSQRNIILNHLKAEGHITPLEALFVHRVHRLASRVEELRNENLYIIDTVKAKDAAGNEYTRYVFTGVGPSDSSHGFVKGVMVPRRAADLAYNNRRRRTKNLGFRNPNTGRIFSFTQKLAITA